MRKSIALFVTITFLFIVVGIIATILAYTQKASKQSVYVAQNSIFIKYTINALNQISKDINDSDTLKILFSSYPFSNKEGNFRFIYQITPLFNRLDINSYLQDNKINPNMERFLTNTLEYYRISDPVLFKDLILDTLDTDKKEREGYSEIILKNPDFQNGKIYNYSQFKTIMNYYYSLTEDKNIYKIPWQKLIFFGDGENHILECNLISKQLATLLGLQFQKTPNCKNILTNENKQIDQNYDIIEFKNEHSFWIDVNITYFLNKNQNNINIIYDIHNKKVISIESNPVY